MAFVTYYVVELVDDKGNGKVVAREIGFSKKEQDELIRKMQDSDLIQLYPTAIIRPSTEMKDPNA